MSINGSKNELWSVLEMEDRFVVQARRFGHGVGMSQRGAMKMGELGYTYDQILGFYYPGSRRVQYTLTQTILAPEGSSGTVTTAQTPGPVEEDHMRATVKLQQTGQRLAVLDSPGGAGQVILGLSGGTMVELQAVEDEWAQIALGELVGFVPAACLQYTQTPDASLAELGSSVSLWATVNAKGGLNLRRQGSKDAVKLAEIPENEIIPVFDREGDWRQVQYGLLHGYVDASYLRFSQEYPVETTLEGAVKAQAWSQMDEIAVYERLGEDRGPMEILTSGETVTLLACMGDWRRIRHEDTEGWILASDLTAPVIMPIQPDQEDGVPYDGVRAVVATEKGSLNLRQSPSGAARILQQIPKGDEVVVLGLAGSWSQVQYGDTTGYVQTIYLKMKEEDADGQENALAMAYVHISSGTLKLRATPSTKAESLAAMKKGA